MLIAQLKDGVVTNVADYQAMFPNTSFPDSGPNADFMVENNLMPVQTNIDHDTEKQFLEPCEPYIMGESVCVVKVAQII